MAWRITSALNLCQPAPQEAGAAGNTPLPQPPDTVRNDKAVPRDLDEPAQEGFRPDLAMETERRPCNAAVASTP
jgi:hypothetical protein